MSTSTLSSVYVDRLDAFIGQERVKSQALVAIKAAAKRGTRLPHMLITSPEAGIGKTTLAQLIANEVSAEIAFVSGKPTADDIITAVESQGLTDGDVLFLDEIHLIVSGGTAAAEGWILHALHDGVILRPSGDTYVLPDITFIGATTDANELPATILDRFKIRLDLMPYTEDEAVEIIIDTDVFCIDDLPLPGPDQALMIAEAANYNPRQIRTLLETIADITLATKDTTGVDFATDPESLYDIPAAIAHAGLTNDGLNADQRRYLIALGALPTQKAGVATLSNLIGVRAEGIRRIERGLLIKGLIEIGGTGRTLTDTGRERVALLDAEIAPPALVLYEEPTPTDLPSWLAEFADLDD